MTGYDPYSYGQIKLGGEGGPKIQTPDDILFEDAGPKPDAVFATDQTESDWELPESTGDPQLGGLQNVGPASCYDELTASAAPAQPARTRPEARARPQAGRLGGQSPKDAGGECMAIEGRPTLPARPRTHPLPRRPRRRRMRLLGAVVPPFLFAAGAGGAGWFYMLEHNVVLAGIVAGTGVIGTAFTRLLFK